MSKLDEAIKSINSRLKNEIVTKDIDAVTFSGKEFVPFNSPAHTFLFRGGFKVHTFWQFIGGESSSKTTTALSILGAFQKYYKKKWENRVAELQAIEKPNKAEKKELADLLDMGYKKVAYIDVEHNADAEWASKMGFDIYDCVYVKVQDESAEDIYDIINELIASGGICLVVLDSIGSMVSRAQLEKSIGEKTYGGVSLPTSNWVNQVRPMLHKYDCSIIAINQIRDVINSTFPTTRYPGGHALAHACDVIASFRKTKPIDENYKEIANKSDYYFGQYFEIHLDKCRIYKPDRKLTRQAIVFDKGLYPLLDTINMAIDYGIISKSGAWYELDDEEGNPIIDSDNETMKWQGLTNTVKYFETHEKEYQDLFNKVTAEVCKED